MSKRPSLPFATPDELGLDATRRPGYSVIEHSRFDDPEQMPDDVQALLNERDSDDEAQRREDDEREAAEEAERDSRISTRDSLR